MRLLRDQTLTRVVEELDRIKMTVTLRCKQLTGNGLQTGGLGADTNKPIFDIFPRPFRIGNTGGKEIGNGGIFLSTCGTHRFNEYFVGKAGRHTIYRRRKVDVGDAVAL